MNQGPRILPVQVVRGACYAFTQETYDAIGEFGAVHWLNAEALLAWLGY